MTNKFEQGSPGAKNQELTHSKKFEFAVASPSVQD